MKADQRIVTAAFLLSLASFLGHRSAFSAEPPQWPPPAAVVPAQDAGWTLVFRDDFERHDLGENWRVVDGQWIVKDGHLRGSGILISARGIPADGPPGFQRLEFDAVTDVQPIIFFKNKPKPRVVVGDLSSFIQAQAPEKNENPLATGYFFQFGGMNNTVNQVQRAKVELQADWRPQTLITPDQLHHMVAENDRGRLRLIVDGKTVLDTVDPQPLVGQGQDRVGLFFYTAAKVDHVKVYVKRPP